MSTSSSMTDGTYTGHPRSSELYYPLFLQKPRFSGAVALRRTATPEDTFRYLYLKHPNMWGIPADKVVNGFYLGEPQVDADMPLQDDRYRLYKIPNVGYPLVVLRGDKILHPSWKSWASTPRADVTLRLPLNVSYEDMANTLSFYNAGFNRWVLLDDRKIPSVRTLPEGFDPHRPVIANGAELDTYLEHLRAATGKDHGFMWVVYEQGFKPTYGSPGEIEGQRQLLLPLGQEMTDLVMSYVGKKPRRRVTIPAVGSGAGGPDPTTSPEHLPGGVKRKSKKNRKESARRRSSRSASKRRRSRTTSRRKRSRSARR